MTSAARMAGVLGLGGALGGGIGYAIYEYAQDRVATGFRLLEERCADWFAGRDATQGLHAAGAGPDGQQIYSHPRSGLVVRFEDDRCDISDEARPFSPKERAAVIAQSEAVLTALLPDGIYENHEDEGAFTILRSVKDRSDESSHAYLISQWETQDTVTDPSLAAIHLNELRRESAKGGE